MCAYMLDKKDIRTHTNKLGCFTTADESHAKIKLTSSTQPTPRYISKLGRLTKSTSTDTVMQGYKTASITKNEKCKMYLSKIIRTIY